jgi:hypothetical protein
MCHFKAEPLIESDIFRAIRLQVTGGRGPKTTSKEGFIHGYLIHTKSSAVDGSVIVSCGSVSL